MSSEHNALCRGLTALDLPVDQEKIELLLKFNQLIRKWNKVFNLTAIVEPVEMVQLHLLDSLAVVQHLRAGRIADIGTGAGLPGIPLAIYKPENTYVLLDSNAKKTRFVQQAIVELKLKNVAVVTGRVEQFQPEQKFDCVISRAFASIHEIQRLTAHLLNDQGELLAMKGLPDAEELCISKESYSVIPLHVPGIEAERCLIKIPAIQN